MTKHRYHISGFPFRPDIELEIEHGDEGPPCFMCGRATPRPSMAGPLICPTCDCGYEADGARSTAEQAKKKQQHFKQMIATYRIDKTEA